MEEVLDLSSDRLLNERFVLEKIVPMSCQSRQLHTRPSPRKVPLNSKRLSTIIVIIGATLHQGFYKILWFFLKIINPSWLSFRLSSPPQVCELQLGRTF